jgi:hypothetical protein
MKLKEALLILLHRKLEDQPHTYLCMESPLGPQFSWTIPAEPNEPANRNRNAAYSQESPRPGLVYTMPAEQQCRRCGQTAKQVNTTKRGELCIHERMCPGKGVFGEIIGTPLRCAMCPTKSTMTIGSLEKHYRSKNKINLRTTNIKDLFKEQYNERLPHPDMNNSYGLWLTRRSVLSGNASDTEISQLWSDFTLAPSSFQGPKLATFHKNFRVRLRKLFGGSTPISFHAHISDVVPSTISSILRMLKEYSPAEYRAILPAQKDNPKFAVLDGSFGAAYGPGVYQCVVPTYRSSAAGQPHPVMEITTKSTETLMDEVHELARDGCVAIIVEIVRSLDGRVMEVDE